MATDISKFRAYIARCALSPSGDIIHPGGERQTLSKTLMDCGPGSTFANIVSQMNNAGCESPVVSDEEHVAELKSQIEALGDGHPMWSRGALTSRGTQHIVFTNGAVYKEGYEVENTVAPVGDLIRLTLDAVRRYRETIQGEASLVWRAEPEIQRENDYTRVRVRLCFEPTLVRVADGVWIEERLNLDSWGRPR